MSTGLCFSMWPVSHLKIVLHHTFCNIKDADWLLFTRRSLNSYISSSHSRIIQFKKVMYSRNAWTSELFLLLLWKISSIPREGTAYWKYKHTWVQIVTKPRTNPNWRTFYTITNEHVSRAWEMGWGPLVIIIDQRGIRRYENKFKMSPLFGSWGGENDILWGVGVIRIEFLIHLIMLYYC